MNNRFPKLTVLLPVLNEEKHIESCLKSIINGNYPISKMEILIIDGGSNDSTQKKVLNYQKHYSKNIIKLLHNPKKIVPAALNIGVKAAQNNILIWLGAHAQYDKNYIIKSVETLLDTKAASVGGVIIAKGKGCFGQALALATSTKLGIGNAKYRSAKKTQAVDTVFGGCWHKESIIKIGGFNERWKRNQDYEFNYRLRSEIGEIILNPEIKCNYYVRESPSALIKQYFQYGYWKFRTIKLHPHSLRLRQIVPVCLFWSLIASLLLLPYFFHLGIIIPFIYTLTVILSSVYNAAIRQKWAFLKWLPLIYPILHLSWAAGFTYSLASVLINTKKANKLN